MSMMRSDPFRETDRLIQQLIGGRQPSEGPMAVPIDAYRKGEAFVIELDLPGVDSDSIELTVDQNVVTVSAKRRGPWADEGVDAVIRERPHGTFTRQLFLGENLDAERIEADYRGGVLQLTVPVAEKAKPRRIQVTSKEGSASAGG